MQIEREREVGGIGIMHVYGRCGDCWMSDFRRPGEDPKAIFMESLSTELQSDVAPLTQGPGEVHSLRGGSLDPDSGPGYE